ncbi:Peptidase S12 Pab87-related C-terminal [Penicillium argentinense]|uniref:Peptidase S12 Pab87-related C-terminal n=1 Tax=Penicillium argentinense TaxID=1131581 RepID=A0A9W9KLK8_9EURO|nr:Peptidase S12 Pab87-related C-terminal [Penicillium argentinense]KAJ5111239.1 Peptidase S12 Pab87-related C-terminal [Penicillium argentinense]
MYVSNALEQRTGESLGSFMKKRNWNLLWLFDEKGGFYYHLQKAMNWMPNKDAGAMVSTVLDYTHWLRAMIETDGPLKAHDSLTKHTFHFETSDINPPTPYHAYALGWFMDNYRGLNLYWYTDGWPGFGSYVGFIPEKFGFAFMGTRTQHDTLHLDSWITLKLVEGQVTAEVSQGTLPSQISFNHANVEFYVNPSGTVTKIGMDLELAMKGEKIWFERGE